jgi:hypothetical protein
MRITGRYYLTTGLILAALVLMQIMFAVIAEGKTVQAGRIASPSSVVRKGQLHISLPSIPAAQVPLHWYQTGLVLGMRAGLTPTQTEKVLTLIWNNTVDRTPDFLLLLVSVAYTESHMRLTRTSEKGATGILQVTAIAAREVDRSEYTLHIPAENIRTGSKYLQFCIEEQGGDIIHALAQYNGGYRAVRALDAGEDMPDETAQYIIKVLSIIGENRYVQ